MASKPGAQVTRADVARHANVSPATVSYVLNDVKNQTISESTRMAVRRAAAELGYRPNLAARNLAAGSSGVVVYVIPDTIRGGLALEVGSMLSSALVQHGVVLSVQFESDAPGGMADTLASLRPVAVTSVLPLGATAAAAVAAAGIPLFHAGGEGVHQLDRLHLTVGEAQVTHLIARGHRKLAFALPGEESLRPLSERRFSSVRAACNVHGLADPPAASLAVDGSNAAEIVGGWIDSGVTAVCAYNDETALIVLHGLRRRGLRCPEDLAVIGIDADPIGFVSDPPLTTVAFESDALVAIAVTSLLEALGYRADEGPPVDNLVRIVERQSS